MGLKLCHHSHKNPPLHLPRSNSTQSALAHPVSLRSILMLFSHICMGLPSSLLSSGMTNFCTYSLFLYKQKLLSSLINICKMFLEWVEVQETNLDLSQIMCHLGCRKETSSILKTHMYDQQTCNVKTTNY